MLLRRALLVAPLGMFVAGCAMIFGLDEGTLRPEPDASPDGALDGALDAGNDRAADVSDADVYVPPCDVLQISVQPDEADTFILQASPGLNWGGAGIVGIRNDLGGPGEGLFRFDVSALPINAAIQSAVLDLEWGAYANDCASNCGSCASIDKAGTIDLYFLRSDWDEMKANWNTRDGTNPWGLAGALLAGTDRSSSIIATATRALGQGASFSFGAASTMISSWRTGTNKLSFLFQAEGTALFGAASREARTLCPVYNDAGVSQNGAAPKLTITYCP